MRSVWVILIGGLMIYVPCVHAGEALGTLFTTPAQRAALDKLRVTVGEQQVVQEVASPEVTPETSVKKAKGDGVIVNSKGESTAWGNRGNNATVGRIDGLIKRDGNQVTPHPAQKDSVGIGAAPPKTGNCRSTKNSGGEVNIVCE